MDTPSPPEQAPRSRRSLYFRLALIVTFLAVGVNWLSESIATKGPDTDNLLRSKQVATACRLYAANHEGRFPVHLRELEPDYLSAEEVQKTRYQITHRGRLTGESADWLYFGADFREHSDVFVLIASPSVVDLDGKLRRIFAMSDTSAGIRTEAEYQQRLAETIQRMKALPHRAVAEPSIPDKAF